MVNATMLNVIWASSVANAIQKLLERKDGQSVEEIILPFWSDAVKNMYVLLPGEDEWEKLTQSERKEKLKGKKISFENFKAAIIDAQFALEIERTDH